MQTSYSLAPSLGKVGAIADSSEGQHAVARVASVAIPFGVMTVRDADDLKAKLPTSAAEVLAACQGSGGVALATHAIVSDPTVTSPQYPIGKEFAQAKKGTIFVLVEEAVTQGDQAWVRFANHVAAQNAAYLAAIGGAADQKGAFRKSPDGTAQVATLTPTAANGAIYMVQILNDVNEVVGSAEYIGDGSATAAEIVTGLIAAFGGANGVPGVTLSGTTTLIVTANVAGVPFTVKSIGDGVIAIVATQANVASAAKAPGCYYKTSAAVGTLAVLEVNLGGQ